MVVTGDEPREKRLRGCQKIGENILPFTQNSDRMLKKIEKKDRL